MKRLFALALLAMSMCMLPMDASAQFDLGKLFGAFVSEDDNSRYDELADKAPDYDSLLGTWYYASAKVDYFGDSMIAEYAIDELDDIAQDLLDSYGVDAGFFKTTINRNGKIVGVMGDEKLTGKFTYDRENAEIEMFVTLMDVEVSCDGYVEQYNNRLKVYLDAEDLFEAYKKLGINYNSSIIDIASGIITRFDDIYIAITLSRS